VVTGYVCFFVTFHGLWPLRHFVLYKHGVSWHEEGHLHAWHMKLRTKHGWIVLLVQESNGRSAVIKPTLDPIISKDQKRKVEVRPHALMLYTTMLATHYMIAGRNLSAIHPYSCFSLNGRDPAPLYGPPQVDLLDYVGRYELIPPLHPSAVGQWLTPMPPVNAASNEGAHCDSYSPSSIVPKSTMQEGISFLAELRREAGVTIQPIESLTSSDLFKPNIRRYVRAPNGAPAYMQEWHRVNSALASYLARRQRKPTPSESISLT